MEDVPGLNKPQGSSYYIRDHLLVNVKVELDQLSSKRWKNISLFTDTGKKELDKCEFDNNY
jgi:hypothetical protein